MTYLKRAFCFLAFATVVGYVFETANAARAQTPQYVAVTTESLRTLAQRLKQDLQDGAILMADLHAIQLRLALSGVMREEMSASISAIEQQPEPDKNQPQLTSGLVPIADKLIQAARRRDQDM